MNHCIPDWNYDVPVTNQKKPIGPDHELVELLWRNGQIVLHSQTHRKPSSNLNESRLVQNHDQPGLRGTGGYGNLSSLTQDEETVSWIQYPIDDSFEKEFCSNFFTDLPPAEDKLAAHVSSSQQPELSTNPMPPPRFQFPDSGQRIPSLGSDESLVNFSKFPTQVKGDLGSSNGQLGLKGSVNMNEGDVRECSAMTVGSSHCASNQVLNDLDSGRVSSSGVGTAGLSVGPFSHDLKKIIIQNERGQTDTLEQTVSSSSGGSGSSFGRTFKQSTGVGGHKRKGRDVEESESQSEAAELESASGNKPVKRSGSSRRSRAAEVHNLSERRRRDRINEKMKALQELIPHSNKTDKASMLDEAIEYLKSLQLQLQMMWMGGGMAPMMFPGAQHCLSRMGMGMGSPALPSMHFPSVPLIDQSISVSPTQNQPIMCQTPFLNPLNYQQQMHNASFPEQYARYMNFHPMQTASQPMNMFRFGSQMVQQNQPATNAGSSVGPGPFNGEPSKG